MEFETTSRIGIGRRNRILFLEKFNQTDLSSLLHMRDCDVAVINMSHYVSTSFATISKELPISSHAILCITVCCG